MDDNQIIMDQEGDTTGFLSGLTPVEPTTSDLLNTLTEEQKELLTQINDTLSEGQKSEKKKSGLLEGIKDVLEDLKDDITKSLGGKDAMDDLLPREGNPTSSTNTTQKLDKLLVKMKERPTKTDMLQLPAEYGMGAMFLYWKLDEMQKLFANGKGDKKDEKGVGAIGNFFSGLLKGAAGIALVAGGLMLFAGALTIFAQLGPDEWSSALFGIGAFAAIVIGAIQIAKSMQNNIKEFMFLGIGAAALSASLIMFGGAVRILASLSTYELVAAIPGIAMAMLFIKGMTMIANTVQSSMKDFVLFGAGTAILSGSLMLFAGAVKVMSTVVGDILTAIPGIAVFMAFILGMVGISTLVSVSMPQFVLFGAGTLVLSLSLIAFGESVRAMSAILPELMTAIPGLVLFAAFMTGMTAIAGAMAIAVPFLIIFGAGAIVMSAGITSFSKAIIEIAGTSDYLPIAKAAAREYTEIFHSLMPMVMEGALKSIAILAFAGSVGIFSLAIGAFTKVLSFIADNSSHIYAAADPMKQAVQIVLDVSDLVTIGGALRLGAFSLAIAGFAESMISFVDMLGKVEAVVPVIPGAIVGLQHIMKFLSNPNGGLDSNGSPISAGAPGVIQMMDAMGFIAIFKLGLFSANLDPFAESMIKMATAIKLVSEIGGQDKIDAGIMGVRGIFKFLAGDSTDKDSQQKSVIGILDTYNGRVFSRLKQFANGLAPFSEAMLNFTQVVAQVAEMNGRVDKAQKGLDLMFQFLVGGEDYKGTSVLSIVDAFNNDGFFSWMKKSLSKQLKEFGEGLAPFSASMLDFSKVISEVAALSAPTIVSATSNLGKMSEFLETTGKSISSRNIDKGAMENFSESIQPLSEGLLGFFAMVGDLSDGNKLSQFKDMQSTLTNVVSVLNSAGSAGAGAGRLSNIKSFTASLKQLGLGLDAFSEGKTSAEADVLSSIADSLDKIANISFSGTFDPLIKLLDRTKDMASLALALGDVGDVLSKKSGGFGKLAAEGGTKSEIKEDDYKAIENSNPVLTEAVVGMYELMRKWDETPREATVQQPNQNITNLVGGKGQMKGLPGGGYSPK